MERKRKLPARAAARVEHESKRRQSTPRERSEEPEPVVETRPQQPPLPRSVESGKPLPTVESAQDDVSAKDYQSIGESGVLAESLARSRNRWINDGLFEKYWTKPHKRKGVTNEDPKNPPKESMSKVGTVTITIEPHIIDATMYVVKDPKPKLQPPPPPPQAPPTARPIIQYGPPGGSMPPETPIPTNGSPAPELSAPKPPPAASPASSQAPGLRAPSMEQPAPSEPPRPSSNTPSQTSSYPQRPPSVPASTGYAAPPPAPAPGAPSDTQSVLAHPPSYPPPAPAPAPAAAQTPAPPGPQQTTQPSAAPAAAPAASKPPSSAPGAPAAKPAANDPVIALLAQRASGDAALRDLMKRVAVGQAKEGELQHFQTIINQLNAEYKRTGGQQGPSADRLLVDGKTVRYFADEVCAILDIVLASNPNQRASDLRPPPRSNPVVIALVKKALDDTRVKDMCKRISTSKPNFTDATDLKDMLDRLVKETKSSTPQGTPAPPPVKPTVTNQVPNGLANGHVGAPAQGNNANPQALRSKGPPPTQKPDISAVLFDFGSGDRYLFPKFSILQYYPAPHGQQVMASFLLVRKGSTSDYGGDPELDYYQPVTIRVWTPNGRHLENLFRVVAPQDEVRRYMDDVMDNMKRAEYILLAMRLPRTPQVEGEEPKTGRSTPLLEKEKDKDKEKDEERQTDTAVPPKPSVLWTTTTPAKSTELPRAITSREAEEETQAQYRRLINSISGKESAAT